MPARPANGQFQIAADEGLKSAGLFRPDNRVHELSGVKAPLALAVSGDTLVVASAETGKLHFFEITNPGSPKPIKTLGRSDGPFGKWLADRFHFQLHPRNDNDTPGTDIQHFIAWPATFGVFNPPESGARAVFE